MPATILVGLCPAATLTSLWELAARNPTAHVQPFTLSAHKIVNVPSNWNDKLSSIKNNNKNVYQYIRIALENANLGDGDGFFNDRISSWRCNTKQSRVAMADVTEGIVMEIPDIAATE
ncbi:hypothetical protein QBC36DRAFT_315083 [Triangularia setosa]|uniref:Polyketide synthase n=1 Tax=Triangularia setosa TaxID=2587417 RepID=A0AAN7A4J5_9PEZI|nr:hypothetical protein QBC36DRAFT_315083 [Podospora setosa]